MLQTEKLQQKEEYQEEIMPDTLKFQDPVSIEEEESLTPYLDKYTENVTEKIRKKIDNFTVFGRDREVEQVIVSLLRQTKNSPILVGEAGTGKTAIVDGLVVEILKGNVPDEFKHVTVRSLELSNISSKSDGEDMVSRLKRIIEELKVTKGENILFIDEVHTIVGAGGDGSMLDAGNVIKPPLARGEIQMISATTYEEYQSSIESGGSRWYQSRSLLKTKLFLSLETFVGVLKKKGISPSRTMQ